MDGADAAGGAAGVVGKVPRGRRSWSKAEKDALIRCLHDIITRGWKADNGFRAGFQRELEKGMRQILPGCDLLATPHINSKIHVWKKEYGVLSDLLSKSGIGWNSSTNTLDILKVEDWDTARRNDVSINSYRNKNFPYFDDWQVIFGKDRATGEHAQDPMDFVNELLNQDYTPDEHVGENKGCSESAPEQMNEGASVCMPSESGSKKSKGTKRKQVDTGINLLSDKLGDFIQSSDSTFIMLADKLGGRDNDPKYSIADLSGIMNGVPGLSLRDKLRVSDELIQNTKRLEFFLTLPEDEQHEYVRMLRDGGL